MPYDYPHYSSSTLGRKTVPSSSHWSSSAGTSRGYGSSGYSGLDSSTTYSRSPLSSMSLYLPPRTPSVPSSPLPSHRQMRQPASQYVASRPAPMSSAMMKRDTIIRTLVRSSHDLESHHFLSNDTVSMITGSNYYHSSARATQPSPAVSRSKKFSRSYTADLSNASALASTSSSYRTSSPVYTVPDRAYRDPYRPIVIERPALSHYVPPPKEERSKALPRVIRRDRPLIKFMEREDFNPVKVRHLLDSWSKGETLEEEGAVEDETENKKRDSVRSNDSGIGSYRSSFLRRSRQKYGDVTSDQATSESTRNDAEDNERHANRIPKAQTPSVDEGVHLDTDEGFRTPTPVTSPLGFRDDILELCDESKSQNSISISTNDNAPSDNNVMENVRTKRRVRICPDKYVDSSNDKEKTTDENNNSECSRNLTERRSSNTKRVRTTVFDSEANTTEDDTEMRPDIDILTKSVTKTTSDLCMTQKLNQQANISDDVQEINVGKKSSVIKDISITKGKASETSKIEPKTSSCLLVKKATDTVPATHIIISESDKSAKPKLDNIQIEQQAEKCQELSSHTTLAPTESTSADTEIKKKKKIKKLDGEIKKIKPKKIPQTDGNVHAIISEQNSLQMEKLSSEINKNSLESNQLKTGTAETCVIPLEISKESNESKTKSPISKEISKHELINTEKASIPAVETITTTVGGKTGKGVLVNLNKGNLPCTDNSTTSKPNELSSTNKLSTVNRSSNKELKAEKKSIHPKPVISAEKSVEELNANSSNQKLISKEVEIKSKVKPLLSDTKTAVSLKWAEKVKQPNCDDESSSSPKSKTTKFFGDKLNSLGEQEKSLKKLNILKTKDESQEKSENNKKPILDKSVRVKEVKFDTSLPKESNSINTTPLLMKPKIAPKDGEKRESAADIQSLVQTKNKAHNLTKNDREFLANENANNITKKNMSSETKEMQLGTEIKKVKTEHIKFTDAAVNEKSICVTHTKNVVSKSKNEKSDAEGKKLIVEESQKIESISNKNTAPLITSETKTATRESPKESNVAKSNPLTTLKEKPKKIIKTDKQDTKSATADDSSSALNANNSKVENSEDKPSLLEKGQFLKNKTDENKVNEKKDTAKQRPTEDSSPTLNTNNSKLGASEVKPFIPEDKQISNPLKNETIRKPKEKLKVEKNATADDTSSPLNINISKLENSKDEPISIENAQVQSKALKTKIDQNISNAISSDSELSSKSLETEIYKKTIALDSKCKSFPDSKDVKQISADKKTTLHEDKEIRQPPKRRISNALLATSEKFMTTDKGKPVLNKIPDETESQKIKTVIGKTNENLKLKPKAVDKINVSAETQNTSKLELPIDSKPIPDSIPSKTDHVEKNNLIKLQKSASADSNAVSQKTKSSKDGEINKLRRSSLLDGLKLSTIQPSLGKIEKILDSSKLKPSTDSPNTQQKSEKIIPSTESEIKTLPVAPKTIKRSTTEDLSTARENLNLLQKSQSTDGNGLVKKPINSPIVMPQLKPEIKKLKFPEPINSKSDAGNQTYKMNKIQRSTTAEIVSRTTEKLNGLQKSSSAGCNNFQKICDAQLPQVPSRLQKPPLPIRTPRKAKVENSHIKSTDITESIAVCKNDITGINNFKIDDTQLQRKMDYIGSSNVKERKNSDHISKTQSKEIVEKSILKVDSSDGQTKKIIENSSQTLQGIDCSESVSDKTALQSSVIKSVKFSALGKENKIVETSAVNRNPETDSKFIEKSCLTLTTKEEVVYNDVLSTTHTEVQVVQLSESIQSSLQNTEILPLENLPLIENALNIDGKINKVKKERKNKTEDGEKPKKKKKKKIPIPPQSTDIIGTESLPVINEKVNDKCTSAVTNLVTTPSKDLSKQDLHINEAKDIRNIAAISEVRSDSISHISSPELDAVWGDYNKKHSEDPSKNSTFDLKSPIVSIEKFTSNKRYKIEDFNLLKVLGRGSYGKVMLAELKGRRQYFAMKCLKKEIVLQDNDVECTMIEREVLAMGSNHPYLCTLYFTFQNKSHLFFVMEYLSGGDLMFHIQQSGRFDQDRARFYAAEIVCALRYLHGHGIIYRDAKLDNICIDADGHIRLVDFGFCKLHISRKECLPRNLCGTPDYMAPEIIRGCHYNQSVDWWSFGVLLFEMLVGQSPFNGNNEEELFWSVCNEEAHFPRFVSQEATQLITMLLDKNPETRLGMPGCSFGDILRHPFFRPINWNKIEHKQLEPPFKPTLKSETDVSNFDIDFTTENATLSPTDDDILNELDQNEFRGFTFTNPMICEWNKL